MKNEMDREKQNIKNQYAPEKVDFIIVVTAGRTGSTLLQKLLNQDSKTLIRGENNNFFYYFYRAYHAIEDPNAVNFRVPTCSEHPWYGFENFDSRVLKQETRSLAIKFLLGPNNLNDYHRIGFKEIRFFPLIRYKSGLDLPDTRELIDNIQYRSVGLTHYNK
mgnify:CR=1 FL=1